MTVRSSGREGYRLCQNRTVTIIDELALAERLIAFDTSRPEGIRDAVAFIEGWIEAQGIDHQVVELDGRPSVIATAGEGSSHDRVGQSR